MLYIKILGIIMKKQIALLGIIILFMTISLSGCAENYSKKFIGVWEGVSISENETYNVTFTFNDDKTAEQEIQNHIHLFFYEVDDFCLYLTLQEFPDYTPICYSYKFSNNDTNLTLINESFHTLKLTKK